VGDEVQTKNVGGHQRMKKIYLYLILAGIVVLSVSQIFLWMDQMEMWHHFNLHLMLEGSKPV
jgi:hypothetical protein